MSGRVQTVGRNLESQFSATGDDGKEYIVLVWRLVQVVDVGGMQERISNPGLMLTLKDGRKVYGSQPDGQFVVDRSTLTLTAAPGTYPT